MLFGFNHLISVPIIFISSEILSSSVLSNFSVSSNNLLRLPILDG